MEKNKVKIRENEIVLYTVDKDFPWREKTGLINDTKIIIK